MKKYPLIHIPEIEGKYNDLPEGKQFYNVSTIMRAKPPHRNHIAMLEALCQKSEYVTLNIGSANKMDNKNPFYPEETEAMLRLGLKNYNNFNIVPIPDFHDDEKWGNYLFEKNPEFTEFVSNNDWVTGILEQRQYKYGERLFDIVFPYQILPEEEMIYENGIYISATVVRQAMVEDGPWQKFLVPEIAQYIEKNDLVKRVKELCRE